MRSLETAALSYAPPGSKELVRADIETPPDALACPTDLRRSVILEADDLGLLYGFNEGIRAAYQTGLLTSTCLRANGYAYEHAVHEVLPDCPGIGMGIHLCLNEAECVAPPKRVPMLLVSGRMLRPGFCWLMRLARKPEGLAQIEREFRAQIERALADGIRPDHVNSHRHVHMIPEIFRIACRLAQEYDIPCVRLVRELPYVAGGLFKRLQPTLTANVGKRLLLNWFARVNESMARALHIATPDYFIGVNYTAYMTVETISGGLRAAPSGSVEVLLHPAIGPDPRDAHCPDKALSSYARASGRAFELKALKQPELYDFLCRENWMATNFADWTRFQELRRPLETTPEIPEHLQGICQAVQVSGPPWVSAAREDSRAFAQLAVAQAAGGQHTLDLGTGTGIIAICLAKAGHRVAAADISGAALRTAKANARRNGVSFDCYKSDLLESVPGKFDLIAFNPPYNFQPDTFTTNVAKNLIRRVPVVRRSSGLAMPRPVLKFHQQLIERLIRQAPEHLTPDGRVLLHAYESEVSALMSVLPAGAQVELLHHPGLVNQTVGMLIRLQA